MLWRSNPTPMVNQLHFFDINYLCLTAALISIFILSFAEIEDETLVKFLNMDQSNREGEVHESMP